MTASRRHGSAGDSERARTVSVLFSDTAGLGVISGARIPMARWPALICLRNLSGRVSLVADAHYASGPPHPLPPTHASAASAAAYMLENPG